MPKPQTVSFLAPLALLLVAATDTSFGPHYTADGALQLPTQYREWVFLSSGLDMSYSDAPSMMNHSMIDNVMGARSACAR